MLLRQRCLHPGWLVCCPGLNNPELVVEYRINWLTKAVKHLCLNANWA
ncbi:hypothetical protein EV13_1123 [Prochlorococcus sp. MIT 0702]|nr:hypothetical protein EV12_1256 [Prochlorococcus sp. MIT 0701]KGG29473.1 hypothetical protein EV13_1123 [Prochlorococcus sp. MIT 0702]